MANQLECYLSCWELVDPDTLSSDHDDDIDVICAEVLSLDSFPSSSSCDDGTLGISRSEMDLYNFIQLPPGSVDGNQSDDDVSGFLLVDRIPDVGDERSRGSFGDLGRRGGGQNWHHVVVDGGSFGDLDLVTREDGHQLGTDDESFGGDMDLDNGENGHRLVVGDRLFGDLDFVTGENGRRVVVVDNECFGDTDLDNGDSGHHHVSVVNHGSLGNLDLGNAQVGHHVVVNDGCLVGNFPGLVDLGDNPFLVCDTLYQFIDNAIDAVQYLEACHNLGFHKHYDFDHHVDVNVDAGLSSENHREVVQGSYANGNNGDRYALCGDSDHEVSLDPGLSSKKNEIGVHGSYAEGHHGDHDLSAGVPHESSYNVHPGKNAMKVDVLHESSGGFSADQQDAEDYDEDGNGMPCDDEGDEMDGEHGLNDELVPWGVADRLGRQRMRKIGKKPFARMTKSKRMPHIYTMRGCIWGKHGLGLKAC